jgi:hypothetical protein
MDQSGVECVNIEMIYAMLDHSCVRHDCDHQINKSMALEQLINAIHILYEDLSQLIIDKQPSMLFK